MMVGEIPDDWLKYEYKQCYLCKWWKPIYVYTYNTQSYLVKKLGKIDIEHHPKEVFEGHCYRYPPQYIKKIKQRREEWPEWYNPAFVYLRPITKAFDRCGEFQISNDDDDFNREIDQSY